MFHRIIVLRQWHWEKMRMQFAEHFPAATYLEKTMETLQPATGISKNIPQNLETVSMKKYSI